MKLFFVTGIANSNWSHIAEALQTPCQKVSEKTFSKIKETNNKVLKKDSSHTETINEALLTLNEGIPSVLADADIFTSLNYWATSSDIQFLVLYCAPHAALANALQENVLSNDECKELVSTWTEQTKTAYDFYLQHKKQCLLLDVQDVLENQELAAKDIAVFLEHETKLNTEILIIAPEAKLAANLLTLEQDYAFELYDEIRSAAPLLGTLTLSGVEEESCFTEDALNIVRRKHAEQRENQKNIRNIKGSLTDSLEKNRQQQADHAAVVNISNDKINDLTHAISECQEQLALTTKQTASDNQALQQKADSLEQLLAETKHALSDANNTQKQKTAQYNQQLANEQALVIKAKEAQENEQTTKVFNQNELAKTKATLNETLKNQSELNKQHDIRVIAIENTLSEARSEQELFILQITQLQEELEDKYFTSDASKEKFLEQVKQLQLQLDAKQKSVTELAQQHVTLIESEAKKLSEATTKNTELDSELEQSQSEQELILLQLAQLQEELENKYSTSDASKKKFLEQVKQLQLQLDAKQKSLTELAQQHVTLIESEAEKLSEARTKNTELEGELEQSQSEQELILLQLTQLQEELESLYQTNQTLNSRHEKHLADTAEYTELAAKMPVLEAENEIAVLQINQLQEELEYYYLQLQEQDTKKMQNTPTIEQLTQDAFAKCHIERFDVVGGYDDDGYADIQFVLHGVKLADGRQFDSLPVKLIEVDSRPGLEFRPSELIESNPPLSWREDMHDEYGAYIKFIPNPSASQAKQQQKTNERLNASERLLILSVATALSDALQQAHSDAEDLQDGKFRDWKLVALNLQQQIADLPAWLSFDAISLIEEMRSDNYEHLWVSFDNLLVNNHLYPNFKLKFVALGPLNEATLFTDTLMLELREQEHGGSPLQAWPPAAQDEYGFKLQANIDLQGEELTLTVDEKLSWHDNQFLRHLAKNLVNFIYALKQQNLVFERNIDDWLSVADRVNQLSQSGAKAVEPAEVTIDSERKLDFQEYVDLGGYQHLAYQTDLGEGQSLLLKLRAENINPITQIADMSLELRTGDKNVPLAESMFFGEDEYGPRVLIALSELGSENFKQFELTDGGKIVQAFIASINQLIQNDAELNTEQQALWMGLLTKEQ
jgi:hypothetical protein